MVISSILTKERTGSFFLSFFFFFLCLRLVDFELLNDVVTGICNFAYLNIQGQLSPGLVVGLTLFLKCITF